MNNPCKPNCLKLPMCISIRALRCPDLHHYYHETVKDGRNGKDAWEHIRSFLPNAGSISNAGEDYLPEELEHVHMSLKPIESKELSK